MRQLKVLLLSFALILGTGSAVLADDLDDMTMNEIKEAYKQLEAENKALAEENEKLQNLLSSLQEDEDEDTETSPAPTDTPVSNSGDALYEQTYINCMVYGEGSDRRYEMIVEVTNTGDKPLYLNARSFDLEDKDGHLLQTDDFISSAPDVILPGEKGYFYNQFGTSINVDNPLEDIVFIPNYSVKEARTVPHEYPVSDVSFTNDTFGYTMVGRVQNDTDDSNFYLYANVIYYDTDGNCMGITGTNIADVDPGATQSFEITSMGIQDTFDPNNIGSYTIYMREPTYQF